MKDECEWVERLYMDGVSYYMNDDGNGYDADLNITADDLNVDGMAVFEILPEVNGLPVTDVGIRVNNYDGVVDVSKVEVRVWFDRDGNYKGEYADLPKLDLGSYWNDNNVPVKYYGEW